MTKVAAITGACGGIGRAIARRLLRSGFKVCITDLDATSLQSFKSELEADGELPEHIFAIPLDVASTPSIEGACARLIGNWSRVDVLVNNAGCFGRSAFLELTEGEFETIWNINVMGTFRVSQRFGREMIRRRSGKIIHIGSIAALKGARNSAHYAASKAAISALSKTMALELGDYGIAVNTVHPGFIDTAMLGSFRPQMQTALAWRIPSKRLGTPAEVAEVVDFLACCQSTYLTGSEITVDGGLSHG